MIGVICSLYLVTFTHAMMDGQQSVLVKRCSYSCEDNAKRIHQIYAKDKCPANIKKNTKSLYYKNLGE